MSENKKKCRLGGILMTILTVIVGVITILAYLNDICVLSPSQDCHQSKNKELRRPCWEDNIAYIETSEETFDISQRSGLPTVQDCMNSCQRHMEEGCLFWTYHKEDKRCYLQSERVHAGVINKAFTSGSMDCVMPPLSDVNTDVARSPENGAIVMPPLDQINTDVVRSPENGAIVSQINTDVVRSPENGAIVMPPLSDVNTDVVRSPENGAIVMQPLSDVNIDVVRSPKNRDKINFPIK